MPPQAPKPIEFQSGDIKIATYELMKHAKNVGQGHGLSFTETVGALVIAAGAFNTFLARTNGDKDLISNEEAIDAFLFGEALGLNLPITPPVKKATS